MQLEESGKDVFLVLLKARQGPYPFARSEVLRDTVNLPHEELEEALVGLEGSGKIERAEPSRGEVYYFAVR